MRRTLMAALLAVATLVAVNDLHASKPGGKPSGKPSGSGSGNKLSSSKPGSSKPSGQYKNYSSQFGKKFSYGCYYSGKDHYQWNYCCYWPKYRCDCYYCPSACCWYYWCE